MTRSQRQNLFVLTFTMCFASSCQVIKTTSGDRDVREPGVTAQPIADEEISPDICDKNLAQNKPKLTGPVILVHDWGTQLVVRMNKLEEFLISEGVRKEDIYEPSYPYLLSLDRIKERMLEQFEEIEKKYPQGTKFTFITHSLGQFVALYTILEGRWSKKVKKFISLDGFAYGQNNKPALCLSNVCGPIWSHLVPYKNDFVLKLFKDHKEDVTGLDKCSLSSAGNEKVNDPPRAGDFPDGLNVHIEGDMSHRDLIRKRQVFDKMLSECFKVSVPPECVKPPQIPESKSSN